MTFHVLAVCTGNVCRSPQTEQLLRSRFFESDFRPAESVAFSSAGTMALVGSAMPEPAARLSELHGGAPSEHRAVQLTSEMANSADLILALSRDHRAQIARLSPSSTRKMFTLLEYARILQGLASDGVLPRLPADDVPSFRALTELASARRGYYFVPDGSADDVIDPFGRSETVYSESISQILQGVGEIGDALNWSSA